MRIKKLSALIASLLVSNVAFAHPGHELSGFISGVAHPFLGLDHILAMIAVGIWAAQIGGRAMWAVPCAFVGVMILGAIMGMSGLTIPAPEFGIALSVLLLGLLIAFKFKMNTGLGMTIVGVFALFHGYAHGVEMPQMISSSLYAMGFICATAALHMLGVALGDSEKLNRVMRVAGVAIAMAGSFLIFNI
jgi:urease accessory protein